MLGRLADAIRVRKHPEGVVTYIIDRNVNYTNICVARCNFCAFYRPVGSGEGYVLGFEEIFRKIDETIAVGGNQLLLQGGHNPDLPIQWYEDLFRAVKARYPEFKLHALSPPEVLHISRLNQIPAPTVIERLVAAGLDSIPGGGAEILVDRVRRLLNCYSKAIIRRVDRRHAPGAPGRASHHGDDDVRHGGDPRGAHRAHDAAARPAGRDRRLHGVHHLELSARAHRARRLRGDRRRLSPDAGAVAHRARQLRQPAGVVGDAGRQGRAVEPGLRRQRHGQRDDRRERRARGRCRATAWTSSRSSSISRTPASSPKRRNMHYEILGDPIFRERDVPRMLALATARADGDTSVPGRAEELPARSRQGKAASSRAVIRILRRLDPADRRRLRSAGGSVARRRRAHRLGRATRRPRGRGARPRGGAARARQRAHAPRALATCTAAFPARELPRLGTADAGARASARRPDEPAILDAAREAIQDARATGTVLVGDVTNTLCRRALAARGAACRRTSSTSCLDLRGTDADAQVGAARKADRRGWRLTTTFG